MLPSHTHSQAKLAFGALFTQMQGITKLAFLKLKSKFQAVRDDARPFSCNFGFWSFFIHATDATPHEAPNPEVENKLLAI